MPAPIPAPEREPMTCQEFLARHSELLDDELTDALALEMRLHMVGCERCARYDRVLRRGLTLLREGEPILPKADPYLALQEHMARADNPGRRGPAVATLAAAAMVGLFAWSALDRMENPRAPSVAADQTVQRINPASMGLWVDPVASGMDLVGPGLPTFPRSAHAMNVAEYRRPGALPVVLRPASLDRGPYTPLLLEPPDYGQGTDPAPGFAPDGH